VNDGDVLDQSSAPLRAAATATIVAGVNLGVRGGISIVMALLAALLLCEPPSLELPSLGTSVCESSCESLYTRDSAEPVPQLLGRVQAGATAQRVGLEVWLGPPTLAGRGFDALKRRHRSVYAGRGAGLRDSRRLLRRLMQHAHTGDDSAAA
jgi:hypothetical protein